MIYRRHIYVCELINDIRDAGEMSRLSSSKDKSKYSYCSSLMHPLHFIYYYSPKLSLSICKQNLFVSHAKYLKLRINSAQGKDDAKVNQDL
jgi:hypothetical protein